MEAYHEEMFSLLSRLPALGRLCVSMGQVREADKVLFLKVARRHAVHSARGLTAPSQWSSNLRLLRIIPRCKGPKGKGGKEGKGAKGGRGRGLGGGLRASRRLFRQGSPDHPYLFPLQQGWLQIRQGWQALPARPAHLLALL